MTSSVNETDAPTRVDRAHPSSAYIVRLATACVCACGLAGALASHADAQSKEDSPYYKLEAFTRALAHIEQSYVDVPDAERLMHGAVRGMVEELDPHSAYLEPEELRVLQDDAEGRYAGIGAQIEVRDGWLIVSAVLEQSPAQDAGLLPGDRFVLIDGVPARDMPLTDAIKRMRGEPGTRVRVTLRRDGVEAALALELTRRLVAIRAIDARVLPDALVVLRLSVFQETTARELRAALEASERACKPQGGIRGMLLDLRDNPGGLVAAAVAAADAFLEQGAIVQTRGRGDRVLQTQHATSGGTQSAYPIVVLVNSRTASAAEILAGALRDHGRAVVVGERTFGKGSVQNVIGLPDGSALKLTTARYYTPSGRAIQARGIEPDVTIEAGSSDRNGQAIRERDLARHLSPADEADEMGRVAVATDATEPFADDSQARTALQLLRTLIATQAAASTPARSSTP